MLYIEATNWRDAWVKVHEAFANDPEGTVDTRHSNRGFSIDNEIRVADNTMDGIDHTFVGYTDFKLRLFEYNYIPKDELPRILTMLKERHIENDRTYTVVNYLFEQKKSAHSMGSCVTNILIFIEKRKGKLFITFEPTMRIGEATKRLLIDFYFCQQIIGALLDQFDKHDVEYSYDIVYKSKVIYLQSLQAVIIPLLLPEIKYTHDHWLHTLINGQYAKFDNPNYKYKSGQRIAKFLERLNDDKAE